MTGKTKHNKKFLLAALILVGLSTAIIFYFVIYNNDSSDEPDLNGVEDMNTLVVSNNSNSSKNEVKESKKVNESLSNLYVNKDYGFSFSLSENERAVVCENDYPYLNNVNIIVWVEEGPVPDYDECASGTVFDAVFVNKLISEDPVKDHIEELEGATSAYVLQQFDIDISGIEATEVVGIRDTTNPAPLPDRIDDILLENKGMFYIISESFLERDIEIL